ncbi:ATP-binding cassette sub-family A member 1 [Caerostris extrusa]|uniref:ATP-binding cassette sub-family A member 1 n=1 Tax=Caerostris extrusa TaxID=172846 RepID=A0AAV4TWN1_CAEEX|nr:ATP-binding cassette sub-family A member 1 [Caerostris extrusa]
MQRNILKWQNETHLNTSTNSGFPIFKKSAMMNEANIDDVITSIECAIQGFHKQRKILLNGLSRTKEIINYVRSNPLFSRTTNLTSFGSIVMELDKIVNAAGFENLNHLLPSTSKEFLHFLPALLFVVEEFSKKSWSRNFCVDAESLEATQLHWKWLLCTDKSTSFRIPLPHKNSPKKDPVSSSSSFPLKQNFDVQAFSQILLRLSSGMSFTLKIFSHLLRPIPGCDATCGIDDSMMKKMCFLGRLQNVKKAIETSHEANGNEENSRNKNNLLQQFQALFPVDEKIIESYTSFIDVVRVSAKITTPTGETLVSGLRFLDSFDSKDHTLRPSLHVTHSLISLLKNRVSDAAQSSTSGVVEIENVLPDSPLTQEVIRSFLPILPEVTSTLLWTALTPGKVLKLIDDSDKNISVIIANICNSSLSDYFYNPGLTVEEFKGLDQVFCSHHYYDVFEEVFEDPDIQEIVFDASSTDEVSWEDMHDNILETVSLLQDLAERKRADISSFPPLPRWQGMAKSIHAQVTNPSVMLYVLNSKFFYRFCYDNRFQNMSSLNLKHFFTEDQEVALYRGQSLDIAYVSQKVLGILFSMQEIKNIGKVFLGFDLHDGIDNAESSEESFNLQDSKARNKIMTATKRTYDMINSMSKGGLSAAILGSSIPEVINDFSTLITHTGSYIVKSIIIIIKLTIIINHQNQLLDDVDDAYFVLLNLINQYNQLN